MNLMSRRSLSNRCMCFPETAVLWGMCRLLRTSLFKIPRKVAVGPVDEFFGVSKTVSTTQNYNDDRMALINQGNQRLTGRVGVAGFDAQNTRDLPQKLIDIGDYPGRNDGVLRAYNPGEFQIFHGVIG